MLWAFGAAFGEYPLRKIPTAEEVGVQRLWLGMVDPVLDCNGWMLDDQSLLPLFKYGEPVAGTNLIRRGDEVFQVGEHFDIDRHGRLYRPHQYVALAGEHEFPQALVKDKLALPVCETGPKHRFFDYCKNLHRSVETIANLVRSDANAGWTAVWGQQLEFEKECLAQEEQDDPRRLVEGIAAALGSRGLRPAMGFNTPPPPPSPPSGGRPGPSSASNAPKPGEVAEHTTPPSRALSSSPQRPPKEHVSPQVRAREQAIADYLESQGRITVYNQDQGVAGKSRQFDYWVDGVPTEFKSPMPGLDSKVIKGIVNDSIRGPAQARNIIIDARSTGCTQEEAIRGIRRAMGISRGKVDRIEVIGDGYHVTN